MIVSEKDELLSLMLFSQMFFGMGLMCISSVVWLVMTIIGGIGVSFTVLIKYPNLCPVEIFWPAVIPILGIAGFIVLSLIIVIDNYLTSKRIDRVCTEDITATIKEYDTMYHDGKMLHKPVYTYFYSGVEYESSNTYYNLKKSELLEPGTFVDIKINPDDPEEFLDNYMKKANHYHITVGISTIILIIMMIIFLLKQGQ